MVCDWAVGYIQDRATRTGEFALELPNNEAMNGDSMNTGVLQQEPGPGEAVSSTGEIRCDDCPSPS